MAERKTRIQIFPGGPAVDGTEVPVKRAEELWSTVVLEDGSTLRVRPIVTAVVRADGQYDGEGNPLYIVRTSMLMVPDEVPQSLKKPL
jgi:hypothetical protein